MKTIFLLTLAAGVAWLVYVLYADTDHDVEPRK